MKELLTSIPTIIAVIFWLFSVTVFTISVWRKKREMWKMVIGSDGKMQQSEAVLFYWLFLFPFMIFTVILMSILNLSLQEYHIDLIKWVLGVLEAILLTILGYDYFKSKK